MDLPEFLIFCFGFLIMCLAITWGGKWLKSLMEWYWKNKIVESSGFQNWKYRRNWKKYGKDNY